MDHELKQRLIGAVVVTALAAIFIPMLFDDPVDTSGKTVTEVTIPQPPATGTDASQNVPADKSQVMNRQDIELEASEDEVLGQNTTDAESQTNNMSDDQQAQPPITDSSVNEPSPDSQGIAATDPGAPQQPGQASEPTLDTGVVDETESPEQPTKNAAKIIAPTKKPEHISPSGVKQPPVVSEKPKATSGEKATAKTSTAHKTPKETDQKAGSKLVRYSIQAGSFNKKENAQALADKLRKQGMPASIVAKGDLFRVKIGPALDKTKAKDMKSKLDKQNIKGLVYAE